MESNFAFLLKIDQGTVLLKQNLYFWMDRFQIQSIGPDACQNIAGTYKPGTGLLPCPQGKKSQLGLTPPSDQYNNREILENWKARRSASRLTGCLKSHVSVVAILINIHLKLQYRKKSQRLLLIKDKVYAEIEREQEKINSVWRQPEYFYYMCLS